MQVNLSAHASEADLTNYVTNGEWDLIELSMERHVVYYSCCDAPYPDITYTLVLRRRPLFYVFNLILPCVLITGIALLSFYMPSDSGEKVTLGITTLLSMTVFLMVIGESMPPTSEKLPLIGLYYGVTISLVSFATGLSVVTLNIHHRGMRGRAVPRLLRKFVLEGLAKLLFIRLDLPDPLGRNRSQRRSSSPTLGESLGCSAMCSQGSSPCMPTPPPPLLHNSTSISTVTTTLHHPCDTVSCYGHLTLSRHLHAEVQETIDRNELRLAEQDRRDTIRLEWQQVALIIDRLLLWVFLVATVSSTFGIMYMSPHTRLFTAY
ncbi:hypothetical protein HAZT_HAZT000230 [Hyalella azteca]|uniref:Neurotransmitter-gated ion-channel transmembrane domain-containing protein n=1 Tax=Hyalella azteca TaxID=294128 RepID=A0A6A0HAE1_HYAAZ|nr:hypothetical protein HAZT_HAZT000230 [Hyalella azteca]